MRNDPRITRPNRSCFPGRIFLLLFLLLGIGAFAHAEDESRLSAVLDSIISFTSSKGASLSCAVYDPQDTSLVYAHNGTKQMVPASLQKLYTAIGALHAWGEDHRFHTRLGYRGKVVDGVLQGDLVVRGGGDPSWLEAFYPEGPHQVFELWADSLLALGITAITGNLIADISLFPTVEYNSNWEAGDNPYGYACSVSPLSFNANMVRYDIVGDSLPGRLALAANRFGYSYHKMSNEVKTIARKGFASVWLKIAADQRSIVLKGELGLNTEDFLNAAVRNPPLFALQNISEVFRRKGIWTSGQFVVENFPPRDLTTVPLLTFSSLELQQILEVMLKSSSNFIAETLVCDLGPGLEKGREYIPELLEQLGIREPKFRFADGCGLSRKNKTTAQHLGVVLCHAYNQEWFDTFLNSLAVPGEEGTLQKRFPEHGEEPRVFGKTGTMRGISSLAGYFLATDDKLYAFVILCNDVKSIATAKEWQDEILNTLINHGVN